MRLALVVTAAFLALPRIATACATCISSPWGDRTYNVAYLGLILTPFAIALVIGAVLTRCWLSARRHVADDATDPVLDEERT